MGGRLPSNYDVAKHRADIEQQLAIDSASYRIFAKQQSIGRALRGGMKKGTINCTTALPTGAGKTMFTVDYGVGDTGMQKDDENNDIINVDIDYIGELVVDTRKYDIDEENMGIIVLDSSVISLSGNVTVELRHKELLNSEYIPKLLGIDKLDECEVDIGVFRYVFGFSECSRTGIDIFVDLSVEQAVNTQPQLISKHKYPYADEEFLDKEYGVALDD